MLEVWLPSHSTGASQVPRVRAPAQGHQRGCATRQRLARRRDVALPSSAWLVDLQCGDNDFDDFKVRDLAGPFVADGRWLSNTGDARVDNSDNNVLETYGSYDGWRTIVRHGFRADD